MEGPPKKKRSDRGTENVNVAGIQRFFNRGKQNYVETFKFGKSTANQRIEAWWSFLRKRFLNWWMNYFKDFRDSGFYDGSNPIEYQCLQFCFFPILKDELLEIVSNSNHHRIRPVSNSESPASKPDFLCFIHVGASDGKIKVNNNDVITASLICKKIPVFCSNDSFAQLAILWMRDLGINMPKTVNDAERLYKRLIVVIP